jgi:acyl-CoA reductase-like NAD-dependent aldehyde dehydrogenase
VVAEASTAQIEQAVASAATAQRQWATQSPLQRGAYLARFADALASRHEALAQAMAQEVGKPLRDARAEAARAVELVRLAVEDFCTAPQWQQCAEGVHARRVPVGVVAAITPFNHPLAIPLGKMAPALALGNAVVWKPALPAHRTTQLVIEAVVKAGMPDHLIAVVLGDGNTAQRLVRHPQVAAVSVTASTAAGRQLAMTCATALKPLQAELGGNNAVVIMGDVDISRIADDLARAAFSFAGQRCTAGRRILVERGRHRELLEAVAAAAAALQVGRPEDLSTDVGPLISRQQQAAVAAAVAHAAHNGGRIICGGHVPAGFEEGCWYAPTLVDGVSADSPLFTQESFAPIAVVHPFCGFDEAIQLANGVPHGLVATFYGDDVHLQQRFLAEVQAGVVKLNCTPSGVHAAAPFGGWKESGFGPPEHGKWDEELYTRAQALYGFGAYRPSSC